MAMKEVLLVTNENLIHCRIDCLGNLILGRKIFYSYGEEIPTKITDSNGQTVRIQDILVRYEDLGDLVTELTNSGIKFGFSKEPDFS